VGRVVFVKTYALSVAVSNKPHAERRPTDRFNQNSPNFGSPPESRPSGPPLRLFAMGVESLRRRIMGCSTLVNARIAVKGALPATTVVISAQPWSWGNYGSKTD